MTNIILHGILAKEFGKNFRMKIHKAANVIKAIDVNRRNFNKRIFELSREGFNYTMIVDGKKITELEELNIQKEPQEIHLVPLIIGSGGALLVGSWLGVSALAVSAGTAGAGALFAASLINFVVLTAVSIGLQMLLAPKPDAGPQISATTKALSESFAFSNKANVAAQGVPVPVGYGRLKVGSQTIQVSVKSYPQSQNSSIAMKTDPYSSVLYDNEGAESNTNRL
jgi:predicted phage tail protein